MERDSKTKKADANMDKTMMHTINKHLTDHNIPEHIRIDLARVTTNGNRSVFSKYKADAKMLIHENIKPLILEAARNVDKDIIDIQEITPWPRIKIHQISLEEHMPFRHDFNMTQPDKASKDVLDTLKNIIEAEYGITLQHARWIKSINHYMEEAQNNPDAKKHTTIVVQARDDMKKVKEWLAKKYIQMTGNTQKVKHYDEVDNTTICKSCCKHGHGSHNCPTPDKPQCGICAGDHSTNEHKCKVRACQSNKGRRCYTHDILQCANCGGDHMVWNKKQCEVRQLALTNH
jgi:hypothetical protein